VASAVVLLAFVAFFGQDFIEQTDRFGASNWSVQERLFNIAVLAGVVGEHPFLGEGFNFLPYLPGNDFVSVTGNYADGGLLYLLASAGIIGMLSILWIVGAVGRCFSRPALFVYPAAMLAIRSTSTSSMYYPLLTVFVALFSLGLDRGCRNREAVADGAVGRAGQSGGVVASRLEGRPNVAPSRLG